MSVKQLVLVQKQLRRFATYGAAQPPKSFLDEDLGQMKANETFYRELSHEQNLAIIDQMIDTTLYDVFGLTGSDGSMQEGAVEFGQTDLSNTSRQAFREVYARYLDLHHVSNSDVNLNIAYSGVTLSICPH